MEDNFAEEVQSKSNKELKEISSFFSIFTPRQGYFVTPILLNINILVFILMIGSGASLISPDTSILLNWGANFRPLTLESQWWRLLTNCFIHIGIIHLLMNMYALFYIGLLLEPLLGRARFISAYLLTGIIASVANISYYDLTVSAGASGAIFGMYGVFLPLLTTDLVGKRKALLTSITVFVLFNLVGGFSKDGIDNAAHIGGLITGIIIGYSFIPGLKNPEEVNLKLTTIGYLTLGVLTLTFFVCRNLSNDIGKYEENIKTFVSNEAKALEVFKLPRNTPKDKLLYGLKEKGIFYWNQNKKLIDEDDKLNLPTRLHLKDSKLKQYCELRIKSYELMYKAVEEDDNSYKDQIANCNSQITEVLNSLKDM
jgi:rhomboid protease GluP